MKVERIEVPPQAPPPATYTITDLSQSTVNKLVSVLNSTRDAELSTLWGHLLHAGGKHTHNVTVRRPLSVEDERVPMNDLGLTPRK